MGYRYKLMLTVIDDSEAEAFETALAVAQEIDRNWVSVYVTRLEEVEE